jgi:hypothetical protein
MEAFARGVLQAARIDFATGEHSLVFRSEVFADDSDHAHIGEVTCGQREIGCGATKAPVAPPLRRLDTVKCNTAYDENGHGFFRFRKCTCSTANPTCCGWPREWFPGW